MNDSRFPLTDPLPLPEPDTGPAARLLTKLFFRAAEVVENRRLDGGMHLITLQGAAWREARWRPGDKLQVKVGPGLLTRTYTPIHWDAETGRTQILAHALAVGPGSEWVRRASPGQAVWCFGPRRSLDLAELDPHQGVLLGDETTLGLAAAWRPREVLIEVGNPPAARRLLATIGLPATVMTRHPDGAHLHTLVHAALDLRAPSTNYVCAGRARSVQHLVRSLKAAGVPSKRILTKAYWADGKTGLD